MKYPEKRDFFTQVIASKLPLKFQSGGGEYPLGYLREHASQNEGKPALRDDAPF